MHARLRAQGGPDQVPEQSVYAVDYLDTSGLDRGSPLIQEDVDGLEPEDARQP